MPGTYTYPGIYVEEVPSGVRTIVGVSTAETAFIDFFSRGPVDEAVRVTSFGGFERRFGGLDTRSEASYAIQQYFLNGGQVAWVIRVPVGDPAPAELTLDGGSPDQDTLAVAASSPGAWGDRLEVAVIQGGSADQFDLFVREVVKSNGRVQVLAAETHRNLTVRKGERSYAVDVVNGASGLVRLTDIGLGDMPLAAPATPSGGAADEDFQALAGGSDGSAFDGAGNLREASGMREAVLGDETAKTGLFALDRIEPFIFNLLCLPVAANLDDGNATQVLSAAEEYCSDKRAFLIVDIPQAVVSVNTSAGMIAWMADNSGLRHQNAAVYFPRLTIPDVLNDGRPRNVGASGTMAGVYARTDATRGVWKAPAGTDAALRNARLAVTLSDLENGALNPLGINVLRNFPIFGNVSWGGRTLRGADQQASEWKYIPVRRTALFIEESLFQGLKWVVFEPNDEPLWAQIRLNVGAFMHNLFRQGAFQGKTPSEAYFVKCDKETTTQADIDLGVVNILVGFAPLKPAEFVVIKIQQIAGQLET
jgi:phage tail sheath protein FI